jgi:hypothetical protein
MTMTETNGVPDVGQEADHRRGDFRGGVPVRLGDGQVWFLARPRVRWRLTRRDDALEATPSTDLGAGLDRALDAWNRALRVVDFYDNQFRMAIELLRANYDFTDEQLGALLVIEAGLPENDEAWATILDVARGIAPKASAGGDISPAGS